MFYMHCFQVGAQRTWDWGAKSWEDAYNKIISQVEQVGAVVPGGWQPENCILKEGAIHCPQ